jgi:hypothetical protein
MGEFVEKESKPPSGALTHIGKYEVLDVFANLLKSRFHVITRGRKV